MSKTYKVDLATDHRIRSAILAIISKNCEVEPYEGTEVNEVGIVDDLVAYLRDNHYSLLKHDK